MGRVWLALGALSGAAAVVMAALAAHGLALAPEGMVAVRAAVQVQGWHALALLVVGVLALRARSRLLDAVGVAFAAGSWLFAAAVHVGAIWGVSVGPIAPVGGMLLVGGWLLLAVAALRLRES